MTEDVQTDTENTENTKIYSQFDDFLRAVIYEFYDTEGKQHKGAFIALLIASGEVTSLAIDALKNRANLKRLAMGAAGVLALRVGLRYALAGPLGLLLAAGTAASLVLYFVRNRREVSSKIGGYRELVAQARVDFEKLQSDFRDARLTEEQRNLMVDGLMKRLLNDLQR